MKKINIVKESEEFTRIIRNVKPFRSKGYLIFIDKIQVPNYQFGITVSNKVGKAVVRNRIKRQIKSIIDKNNYQNNFKCIIIIKKDILEKDYHTLEKELNDYFKKCSILEEENE
ncbi:MAG: ribonuclease P protein component [Bacilli bacterium]|nr:ribonuclease P protein component [Bacilli bacterium]